MSAAPPPSAASAAPAGTVRPHRVAIVGGGFGGLQAALALADVPVEAVLVDQRNFHLFQPLLYQVATGVLSPANIAAPLRTLLKRQRNIRVLMGEAMGVDPAAGRLLLRDGEVEFDSLILAAGSRHHYFGHDAWEAHAPGLKTVEDAATMRRRIFAAFEAAEGTEDPARRADLLTFVVVGGGPTGVELAGALAETARRTLLREFRRIDPAAARIVLLDAGQRILSNFQPELSAHAAAALARLGVEVRTGAMVTGVSPDGVEFTCAGAAERIAARTILWGAGVMGSPLGRAVAAATGAELDRGGRLAVGPDCSLPGHPGIFVIGDLARCLGDDGQPLPGVAPVAMQQGAYVAQVIAARLDGRPAPAFRYRDRGSMATIGRSLAIAEIGGRRLTGLIAWLAWLFVHLMALVRFENRVLVLIQWSWHYITWNRHARLITREWDAAPPQPPPQPPR